MKRKALMLLWLLVAAACDDGTEIPVQKPVYFLVAEPGAGINHHGDSFILPLQNSADIAEARQILQEQKHKIIFAQISKDKHDNYSLNRDLLKDNIWSWHITSFEGFGDMGIEILDGWPTYVEDNYEAWVNNTRGDNGKGRIGFWGYSIVREVEASELHAK